MTPRPPRQAVAVVALLAAITGAALAEETRVAPPGQEALVGEMLGAPLPPGCKLDGAAIEGSVIKARYLCEGGEARVELRPRGAKGATSETEQFAIVAPPQPSALGPQIAANVRAKEGAWRWQVNESKGPPGAASARSQAEEAEFSRGLELYRQRRNAEAYALYEAMARKDPHNRVLGMVVASLASTHPDKARLAELTRKADERKEDPYDQFVAGVALHYFGHQSAKSVEEKRQAYRDAITYLTRARPAYEFEARLWIYLAVSHFRLGNQKEAEELIEKAVTIGPDDPDAFYCRAEIFQKVNVERSIADIDHYIEMVTTIEAKTKISAAEKNERVRIMREHLVRRQRGEASAEELFDPIIEQRRYDGVVVAAVAGVAALLVGGYLVRRRRAAP